MRLHPLTEGRKAPDNEWIMKADPTAMTGAGRWDTARVRSDQNRVAS
jgi:hypothetical protein